jgi:hypothetical protein
MFKRKHYFALGAMALVAALLLSLPSRAASHLKLGISGLFLPLFGAVSTARQFPGRAADALLPRSELLKEIETLQRENQQLKVQDLQAAATAREAAATVEIEARQHHPARPGQLVADHPD